MSQLTRREAEVSDVMEMESVKNQLQDLLGSDKRKMQSFKTKMLSMATNKMLAGCTPVSLIACGLKAETLGLPLEAGQGYIVKYGKGQDAEAQLDVGYKGWQVLAKRSGLSVAADVVYKCDAFKQDGYGFEVEFNFQPNYAERKPSDDEWAKQNLCGVIVSVREDDSGLIAHKFVGADMIWKITGMSPSVQSEKGRQYSPHENWADQMFAAKAIKSVLSKAAIDVSKATQLHDAIQVVNSTESMAQAESKPQGLEVYGHERFETNWPKWVALVESGEKKALVIITQLSNGFSLSSEQMEKVMTLKQHEPIEGEVTDAETVEQDDAA